MDLAADTQIGRQLLKVAFLVFLAVQALLRMIGKQQLHHGAAGFDDPRCRGLDRHAFHDIGGAGRRQIAAALDLHHADPAGGGLVDRLQVMQVEVAQRRDVHIDQFGRFQDRELVRNGQLFTVDLDFHVSHFLSPILLYFFSIAANGHVV